MKHCFYILWRMILCVACQTTAAQSVAPVIWDFGFHGGLDFRSGQPVAFTSGMNAGESCATQCNNAGNLLFYTDGTRVWNRNHKIVPFLDSGINPNMTSSQQGTNIIPVPGDSSRYYIFRQTPMEITFTGGVIGYINYMVIDMNLDNGKGDVVKNRYNISIDSFMSEKVTVIKNADCSYWLVVHAMDTTLFKCYKITAAGIDPKPVLSYSCSYIPDNTFGSFGTGEMIYSPKRKKLYSTSPKDGGNNYYVEMYDFDPATGIVSNAQMLTDSNLSLYLSLSPNEDMLYGSGLKLLGGALHGAVYQYDVSKPNQQGIINSKNMVFYDPGVNIADMQLGPDNKIYVVTDFNGTSLSRIENPDVAGPGCNFNLRAVPLLDGTHTLAGLPSPGYLPQTTIVSQVSDTTVCFADSIRLSASAGFDRYRWSNSDTSISSVISNNGKYWVKYSNTCVEQTDTFNVTISNLNFLLGNDTAVCDDIVLKAPLKDVGYKWNNGSTDATINVHRTGLYGLTITKGKCSSADSVYITNRRINIDLGADTILCYQTALTLNMFDKKTSYLWNDGSTGNVYTISQPGAYSVVATNETCTMKDTINVSYGECDCIVWMPSAFSPNGDGKNDYFAPVINPRCPVKNYKLQVYDRWGRNIFSSTAATVKWDGYDKKTITDIGTYMYQFEMTDIYGRNTYRKGDITLIR